MIGVRQFQPYLAAKKYGFLNGPLSNFWNIAPLFELNGSLCTQSPSTKFWFRHLFTTIIPCWHKTHTILWLMLAAADAQSTTNKNVNDDFMEMVGMHDDKHRCIWLHPGVVSIMKWSFLAIATSFSHLGSLWLLYSFSHYTQFPHYFSACTPNGSSTCLMHGTWKICKFDCQTSNRKCKEDVSFFFKDVLWLPETQRRRDKLIPVEIQCMTVHDS